MKINEVAKLTGVTVRTLHYYDEIGLLIPRQITASGYRIYDENTLDILQQILFFRELEFSLTDIKDIMNNPNYDKNSALCKHHELLIQKRNRLDKIIGLVENTIKGDRNMNFKEFDMTEIEDSKKKYADEAKKCWGNTDAYKESEQKTVKYNEQQWKNIMADGAEILKAFAENRRSLPDSKTAQDLVEKWKAHITSHFYPCTNEILSCLGHMYIEDERFTQNIDQNGLGTAAFIAKAIDFYCAE